MINFCQNSDDLELIYSIIVELDQAGEANYFETVIIYLLRVNE